MKFLTITTALILLVTTLPTSAQVQSLEAWWIDTGETDSTGLGQAIDQLGDINDDGLNDFIVGSSEEKAFVYLGSSTSDTIPRLIIPRPDSSVFFFSWRLFNIGDVNNDSGEDFIIQATIEDAPNDHRIAYLYFGGGAIDPIPDLILDGTENLTSGFGRDGAGIGDFNGDGGNDIILLDNAWYNPGQGYGLVHLYYGGEILDSIPDWKIHGGNPFSDIGKDAAPLGDVNNDGFDDFVMVDWFCAGPQGEEYTGVAAIYYGGTQPDTLADIIIYGDEENALLGRSVDGIDFDRDGQKDIVVGNGHDYPPDHTSSIHVYMVSPDMDDRPDFIFPDESGYGYTTGNGILGMDLNGDGWQDIVSCNTTNVLQAGNVYIYLGGTNSDTLLDAYYFQGNLESSLGAGGCNAGDINGDGIDDLIIGEPGYNHFYTGNLWGRIHVIQGDTVIHQSVGIAQQEYLEGPASHLLLEIYPNPFNSQVTFEISRPVLEQATLQVFNLKGEIIQEFGIESGIKQVVWNGTTNAGIPCASGIYLARLSENAKQITKKVILIR